MSHRKTRHNVAVASLTPHQTPETTMRQQAEFFTLALWWGALTVIGFGVVPLLFANLETPQAATLIIAIAVCASLLSHWLAAPQIVARSMRAE